MKSTISDLKTLVASSLLGGILSVGAQANVLPAPTTSDTFSVDNCVHALTEQVAFEVDLEMAYSEVTKLAEKNIGDHTDDFYAEFQNALEAHDVALQSLKKASQQVETSCQVS